MDRIPMECPQSLYGVVAETNRKVVSSRPTHIQWRCGVRSPSPCGGRSPSNTSPPVHPGTWSHGLGGTLGAHTTG